MFQVDSECIRQWYDCIIGPDVIFLPNVSWLREADVQELNQSPPNLSKELRQEPLAFQERNDGLRGPNTPPIGALIQVRGVIWYKSFKTTRGGGHYIYYRRKRGNHDQQIEEWNDASVKATCKSLTKEKWNERLVREQVMEDDIAITNVYFVVGQFLRYVYRQSCAIQCREIESTQFLRPNETPRKPDRRIIIQSSSLGIKSIIDSNGSDITMDVQPYDVQLKLWGDLRV